MSAKIFCENCLCEFSEKAFYKHFDDCCVSDNEERNVVEPSSKRAKTTNGSLSSSPSLSFSNMEIDCYEGRQSSASSADNSDAEERCNKFSNIKPQYVLPGDDDEADVMDEMNKDFQLLVQQNNFTQRGAASIIQFINKHFPGKQTALIMHFLMYLLFIIQLGSSRLLSRYRAQSLYNKTTVIKPKVFDICENACHVFVKDTTMHCPKCGLQRFGPSGTPVRTHTQLPVAPQLASLFKNQSFLNLIANCDGNLVAKHFSCDYVEKLIHNVGLFQGKFDLAVSLFIDGFQTHDQGKTSLTIVMLQILNLPPTER